MGSVNDATFGAGQVGYGTGTRVEIWTCNSGPNQQWRINADGTVVGTESGLCLDATGAATGNGSSIDIVTCSGGSHQKWTRG